MPATTLRVEEPPPPPPQVFTEREAPVEAPPRAVVDGIQPGDCPGRVADFPSPYFGDQVLIRLPSGVTEDNFIEYTPNFARLANPIESAPCDTSMPSPVIRYMAMTLLESPDKPLEQVRDEVLEAFGYPETIVLVEREHETDADSGMWVYEVPATAEVPEPAKMLLWMGAAHGNTIALVFEAHPNAWSAVVDTLVASAKKVSVLQP